MTGGALKNYLFDNSSAITSTGSANAYVIETSQSITGYSSAMPPVRFKANFTCSGSSTANINDNGAVTLKKLGGASNLEANDIISGGVYTLIHDGSNLQVLELNSTVASGAIGTAQIADDAVTNAKLANMAQSTIKGRASGAGTGDPADLTAAQATAVLDAFTSSLKGLVPASGGGTTNFLRADGSFAAPPIVFTLSFVSSQQTITSAGALTIAHSLGAEPKIVLVQLECTTAELGYSVGDKLMHFSGFAAPGSFDQGCAVTFDATNIYVKFGAYANALQIIRKDTGVRSSITNTSWKLVVKGYA